MTRQRIAHLNTNALQQLHSYFVSTMSRPHDRQLISDTFAIDDSFMERTLMFQNGDWLMTSFKTTNAQNVSVFFHSINKEDFILDQWKSGESTRNCRPVDFSMVVGFYDLKGTMTGG
jgi:hypothetical protein